MILEETKILKVSPDLSDKDDMQKLEFAGEILRKGGLVAFPTETVYGLGANALDKNAVENIFRAKGRPQDNPLIVHVSKPEDITKYAVTENNKYFEILKDEMPAPLTVILPKRDIIPTEVCAGLDSVGMRVPLSKIARKLIECAGVPVAAPSANLSGKPSPTCAKHVIDDMTGRADVIIDGSFSTVGVESTVVTLCTEPPTILRPGGFTKEMLERLLGRVNVSDAVLNGLKEGEKAASPGMKYKHYAPQNKVVLVKGENDGKIEDVLFHKLETENCAVICCKEQCGKFYEKYKERIITVGSTSHLEDYAEKLFGALRDTDGFCGITAVYAALPKDTSGISLAIYNRMLRAAAFNVINAKDGAAQSADGERK